MKSNRISKFSRSIRDDGGRQTACGDVERHVPAVIEPGVSFKPNLAHDLGPKVQGIARRLPGRVRKRRPRCVVGHETHYTAMALELSKVGLYRRAQ